MLYHYMIKYIPRDVTVCDIADAMVPWREVASQVPNKALTISCPSSHVLKSGTTLFIRHMIKGKIASREHFTEAKENTDEENKEQQNQKKESHKLQNENLEIKKKTENQNKTHFVLKTENNQNVEETMRKHMHHQTQRLKKETKQTWTSPPHRNKRESARRPAKRSPHHVNACFTHTKEGGHTSSLEDVTG